MSEPDDASRLVEAADRDISALQGMMDDSVFAEEIFGFHAQQAAEKLLKAWLVIQGREYPLTHSIARLLALIEEKEPVRDRYGGLNELTAYAVQLRYDSTEPDADPVDRNEAVRTLRALREDVCDRWPQADGRNGTQPQDDSE